jgi:2,4-dienoyl-CoA reductase-like NADH-dependent reductase (Old Yellow Enzyme family)
MTLTSEITIGGLQLPNRIVVAPMCQYSAKDGCVTDWHLMHLMQLAISGAGLIVMEVAATEHVGRITHGCIGLYNQAQEDALARVLAAAKQVQTKGTRWGIQIGHAGRKASAQRPWEGREALTPDENPWMTEAPSPLPFREGWPVPRELKESDLPRIRLGFVQAAERAVRLGFDVVELHAAHGYLLHQFLSPVSNQRNDKYGGSLENRMRFPLDIARAVQEVLPPNVVLGARITGSDWLENGIVIEEAVEFANRLKEIGVGYVGVTSAGVAPARVPHNLDYQILLAEKVKAKTGLPTRAVGLIQPGVPPALPGWQ